MTEPITNFNLDDSTEKKNIIFDSTILNAVQLCAARSFFEFELNLRPLKTATPLEEGDLLHKMMEWWYTHHMEKGIDLVYDNDLYKKVKDEVISTGEEYSVTKDLSAEESSDVIRHFDEYLDHYRMDGIITEFVERAFLCLLYEDDELRIGYAGKIDWGGTQPSHGKCNMDHKSSKRKTDALALSNQFTAYSYFTQTPTLIVNKVGFQKTLDVTERMTRQPLLYPPFKLERWKNNTIWWGQQYAYYLDSGTFPENRTSCDKYGGCIYQPICDSSTEEGRKMAMSAHYVQGSPWDVTKIFRKET